VFYKPVSKPKLSPETHPDTQKLKSKYKFPAQLYILNCVQRNVSYVTAKAEKP